MEAQRVVLIHDASEKVSSRVLRWALNGLSLKPGDKVFLVVVLHEVITPMGYRSSVDSRLMFGANQKIIEEQAARTKEEYLKNEELAQIYNQYKSKKHYYKIESTLLPPGGSEPRSLQSCRSKVEFKIELIRGSSTKAVALKSATNLNATWVILDRKMKKDEDYFLQKLFCSISRVRSHNRILHLRVLQDLPKGKIQRKYSQETYDDSRSNSKISDEDELSSLDISPKSKAEDDQVSPEHRQILNSPREEKGCSGHSNKTTEGASPEQLRMDTKDINSDQLKGQILRDLPHHKCKGKEQIRIPTLKQELDESDDHITCGGSNKGTREKESLSTEACQESDSSQFSGGARNFFLGRAEDYKVCERFFRLCNSS